MSIPTSGFQLEAFCAEHLYRAIDSPISLGCFIRLKNRMFNELADLTIDPAHYNDPASFADDYACVSYLKKSENIPLTVEGKLIDRKAVAVRSFWDSESRCADTNRRLAGDRNRPAWYSDFVANCAMILGPLDRKALDSVQQRARFGPGATTGVRGQGEVASAKYQVPVDLTEELYPFVKALMGPVWHDLQRSFRIVKGNKFFTVPKNAKTERGACTEPTLNSFVQLGIGETIAARLKLFGVNLRDQTRNQNLARKAFRHNLATIDLSAASDSLAWMLVVDAFPIDWVELLTLARSRFSFIEGKWVELEKLCSMGNGFTFPVETVIFYAVVLSFVPHDELCNCAVYGDDIIVPQEYARVVIDALEFLGFQVNEGKTCLAGAFYESCGTDWFQSQPVRPPFARNEKNPGDVPTPYAVRLHNSMWAYAGLRGGVEGFRDARFQPLCEMLLQGANRKWRGCRVPPDWGDVGFTGDEPQSSSPGGWDTKAFRYMHTELVERSSTGYGVLLSAYARPSSGVVIDVNRLQVRRGSELFRLLRKPSSGETWTDGIATYGREPVRGMFGETVPRVGHAKWPTGYGWV